MDQMWIALIGIFTGVLFRTLLPYLRKLKEAEQDGRELPFDLKYLYTALFSLLVSFIVTMLIFPAFVVPDVAVPYLFAMAFSFGYTSNGITNEIIST